MSRQQFPPSDLCLPQDLSTSTGREPRMLRRILSTAFVRMARFLPRRPEPRHVFDNIAAGRQKPRGEDVVESCQAIRRDAMATGDRAIIAGSKAEIIAFHDTLLRESLAGFPEDDHLAFPDASVEVVEELSEATAAVNRAVVTGNPADIERADREVREGVVAIDAWRTSAQRFPNRMRVIQ